MLMFRKNHGTILVQPFGGLVIEKSWHDFENHGKILDQV